MQLKLVHRKEKKTQHDNNVIQTRIQFTSAIYKVSSQNKSSKPGEIKRAYS